ncbi:MAG: triose-phosphate isomerase [Finegoldia sp.]|nr:triose-phosphate isomerase [Finegoldia sp.]
MRVPIIAGNWKMNKTVSESVDFCKDLKKINLSDAVEKVIIAPFTSLYSISELLKDSDIKVGAQNVYYEKSGAYTGEVSLDMLSDLNVDYVILGHSERRNIFKEDNELINKKLKAVLDSKVKPILCCGESLEEREGNKHKDKIKSQIESALDGMKEDELTDKLVIAYEPIWAIGTGKTASSDDAEEMCAYIRNLISDLYSSSLAEKTRIQYGGSVKPENIVDIMGKENIDGALVGGASLDPLSFSKLINYQGEIDG